MNIFCLDESPELSAKYHCDKHVVKMILETCQILSTVHHIQNKEILQYIPSNDDLLLYKPTHQNHPSTVWARASKNNYIWLHSLLLELCKEYTHRYNKIHKCERIGLVDYLKSVPLSLNNKELTLPTPAMPDACKVYKSSEFDVVASYRKYYLTEKIRMLNYKNREIPYWIEESLIKDNVIYAIGKDFKTNTMKVRFNNVV